MAKRKIRSLQNTGRISRAKASTSAMTLRESGQKTGKYITHKSVTAESTASGRSAISFRVKGKITGKERSSPAEPSKKNHMERRNR